MNLLWRAAKCRLLTMHVPLQVMSDFADAMPAIASKSRIITTSIQATVFPSLGKCGMKLPGSKFCKPFVYANAVGFVTGI